MSGTSKTTTVVRGGGGGAVYGLGLIEALVYYWQHAHGFWAHVWAVVEAILWPGLRHLSPARPHRHLVLPPGRSPRTVCRDSWPGGPKAQLAVAAAAPKCGYRAR